MNKKFKQKRTLIFILAVILALAIVSLISDKEESIKVIVLNEELDATIPVTEQLGKFISVTINKSDYEKMGSSFVTGIEELNVENLKITFPLPINSPIPKSLIEYSQAGSELTNSLALYRTWYKLDNSSQLLPPGVSEGDLVDIGVLYTDEETQKPTFGILLFGVKIAKIDETVVYLEVTQEEHSKLSVAAKVGSFVIQLPGIKDTSNCSKLTAEQREITDCYNDYDRPVSLDSNVIIDILKNNNAAKNNAEKIFEKNPKYLVLEGELFDILKGESKAVEDNDNVVTEDKKEDIPITDEKETVDKVEKDDAEEQVDKNTEEKEDNQSLLDKLGN